MKQTVKTSRTAGYLEKLHRKMNKKYFEDKLSEPIITIQTAKDSYGHITCGKVWKSAKGEHFEINISANYLQRDIVEIVCTLLHEMVHQYNLENGIKDTSRGNTYHNRKFKEEAEKRDLLIKKHPSYGWTITEPTEALIDFCIEEGLEDILMGKDSYAGGSGTGTPGTNTPKGTPGKSTGKSSTRKYICPQCGNSFRATKEIFAICGDCLQPFQKA